MSVERFDQSQSSPSGEHPLENDQPDKPPRSQPARGDSSSASGQLTVPPSAPKPSPLPYSLIGTLAGRETIAPANLPDDDNDENLSDEAETSAGRIGRYRLIGILGQGAMGIVYLAHDPDTHRQVALKLPKFGSTSSADNVELLQRFYREARATGNLDHPNICRVYDVGQSDGTHYIAMAYIEGRSLSEFLVQDQQELIPQPQAAMLVRKLADALQHAHGRGVVHRDLKPGNIMLDVHGEPIVMDFGLACEMAGTQDIRLTQTGSILGSPAYMSPEQADGQINKVGPLSDLYSLGVILYELMTGQLPFRGSIASVLAQILTRNPRPPSELRPDVDPQLESICLKMMAKRPSARFASMQQVVEALDGFLKVAATTVDFKPSARPWSSPADAPAVASVVASLADEQLVKARQCQQAIARARREGNLEYAIRWLKNLAGSKSSKIVEYIRWAQQELPKVEAEFDRVQREGREKCGAACEKARTLIQTYDYASARQALELVPVTARSNEHGQLLSEATELADACSSLRQEIDDAVKRQKYGRLAPLVKRYLKLNPDTLKMQRQLRHLAINGPARAVAKFRGTRKYFDVAGRLVEPKELAMGTCFVVALFIAVSFAVQRYQGTSKPSPQVVQSRTPPAAITNSIGMTLVLMPASEFFMGSPDSDQFAESNEKPQHRVRITKPFYLQSTEVTQGQWEAVMRSKPWSNDKIYVKEGADYPATYVSWQDAKGFCRKLTIQEGREYRLPTEAEWEYACRAGTQTVYSFGESADQLGQHAWFADNAWITKERYAHRVGQKQPTAWGLYDMHGNVREWCQDWYDERLYASSPAEDPGGFATGQYRVLRGGSCDYYARYARSADRGWNSPLLRDYAVGFRVVLPLMTEAWGQAPQNSELAE